MRIKFFGIPILEITAEKPEPSKCNPRPGGTALQDPICEPDPRSLRTAGELYRAASYDGINLHFTTCPSGSPIQEVRHAINSGTALTREDTQTEGIAENPASQTGPNITALPEPPETTQYTLAALHTMTAQDLLKLCSRGQKIDIDLALRRFSLSEAKILDSNFRIGSAGYRLREAVRMRQHRQNIEEEAIPKGDAQTNSKAFRTPPSPESEALKKLLSIPSNQLPRLSNGKLDVLAGLKLLNITDPRALWEITPPYGSALHLLKQVVGCTVGNGVTVDFGNGITNVEVREVL